MENTQKKADFCDNFRVKNKQKKENTRKRADFFDHFRVKNEKKRKNTRKRVALIDAGRVAPKVNDPNREGGQRLDFNFSNSADL
jgi:hypothetical protein